MWGLTNTEIPSLQPSKKIGQGSTRIMAISAIVAATLGGLGQSFVRGNQIMKDEWNIEMYRDQIPPGEIVSIDRGIKGVKIQVLVMNGRRYTVSCPYGNGRTKTQCTINN